MTESLSKSPRMYTTGELAKILNVSEDSALRLMQSMPGALRLGTGNRMLFRMPEPVNAVIERASRKSRRGVQSVKLDALEERQALERLFVLYRHSKITFKR